MSWNQYVEKAQLLGFTKVTIVNRHFKVVGSSMKSDIPTAWKESSRNKQINENQELADDWADPKKTSFYFYQKKFNIIDRPENGKAIVCMVKNEFLCAKEFDTIWFVVYGKVPPKLNLQSSTSANKLNNASDAYNKIHTGVWEMLDGDV